ncbi:MAG: hypothetical protein ACQERR_06750 [Pseudomonadota bacterium]
MMPEPELETVEEQTRALLGTEVRYRGTLCRAIELLDEPARLILEDGDYATHVQSDQHGDAKRRVPRIYTIHLYHTGPHGELTIHPDLASLLASNPPPSS